MALKLGLGVCASVVCAHPAHSLSRMRWAVCRVALRTIVRPHTARHTVASDAHGSYTKLLGFRFTTVSFCYMVLFRYS